MRSKKESSYNLSADSYAEYMIRKYGLPFS